MTPNFDTHAAVRSLRAAGIDEHHAEAIVNTVRDGAGAGGCELVTRGELYRALWIQGAGIVAILTAIRFVSI